MSVGVRRLEARDKAAWLPLFKGYLAFYNANLPDDVVELAWQRLMSDAEGFHVGLVAVDETDTPIGFAHILFHRSKKRGRRPGTVILRICSSPRESAGKGWVAS